MATETTATQYICPGEQHAISRSVHLSRLAAFYPKCRECSLRNETGQLTPQTVERIQETERRIERRSFFTEEGIRGVYMNELGRREAFQIAGAMASLLWDKLPRSGRNADDRSAGRIRRNGPVVVVGYDERPSSPDLVIGATAALQRMTCEAVEIGISTRPCLAFAVNHLAADAGLFVSGSGCGPAWTGFDILGKNAMPWSKGDGLEELEERLTQTLSRPARHGGRHRSFQASVPYEAGLWKYFHALRPLRIVCDCPLRHLRATLTRLFEKLPCSLTHLELPNERTGKSRPPIEQSVHLAEAIKQERAHLGFIIDDDAQHITLLDEQGNVVPIEAVTGLIAQEVLMQTPQAAVVLESSSEGSFQKEFEAMHAQVSRGGESDASMFREMRTADARFGGGKNGRWWFQENIPICDAVVSIAKILQAISRSDHALSKLVSH